MSAGRDAGTGLRPVAVGMGWPTSTPGGLNRYVADLHRALRAQGVPVETIVFDAEPGVPGLAGAGSEAAPLPVRLLRSFAAVAGAARRARADVLVSHFALYGLLPAALLTRRRPLVVHFHGPWADEAASTTRRDGGHAVKRGLERLVYRRAAAVVVLSEEFARLAGSLGAAPERIHVLPPGVDLERFRPVPSAERAGLRVGLGVPNGTFVVLTVRRLVARTGVDVLLDAWAQVSSSTTAHRLLVVAGDGPDRAGLEEAAAERGHDVRFLGRVSEQDLLTWNQAADVTVVPSLHLEGFGLVVLESLACGTPVVASDLGGMGEVLPGLDPTLVVPPGDAVALARRLGEAADGRLPGRDACRAFAERFGWGVTAGRLAALYAAPASSRSVPPSAPAARPEEPS